MKKGEFAYNKSYSNGYPWGAMKRLDGYEMGVLSTLYIVFEPTDIDSEFLVQYYETSNWHTEVAIRAAEGARNHGLLNISPSDVFDTDLLIPTITEEQTAIGSFFRTLDDTITLHKRKLDGLKELKSGYLQVMFPQNGETVPRVRYNGFEGEWQERKLGEVFEQTSEYVNPKDDGVELWSLTVENGLTPKTKRYNREFLVKKEDAFKAVSPNEFIYNPMNMTLGAVDLNLMNKKVAVSGYYITMRTKEHHDSNYFSVWLKSPQAIKLYKLFSTGSLTEKQRVQFPTLSNIETLIPMHSEQFAIGTFFRSLDEQITDQAEKLEQLKQLKIAYSQKMFV